VSKGNGSTWPTVRLGTLADFRNGINYNKDNFGKGIRVINVKDFQDYSVAKFDDLDEINPDGVIRDESLLKNGDIIFVRSNGNRELIGRSMIINNVPGPISHSAFSIKVRFNSPEVLPRFYAYLFRTQLIRQVLSAQGGGTNIANLNQTILNNLEVPCPPLPTQHKIASILSAYDDLIENNTRRIAILEEMAQAIYREWFVNFRFPRHENVKLVQSTLGMIPEGWKARKLGDVMELPYGKALKADTRKGGAVAVFGSGGIVGYHDECLSEGPGIIVGRKGNVGSVFWSDIPFYPIDTAFFVKTDLQLHYVYFNLLLSQKFLNSDAAVPGLNRSQAYANPFIEPTGDLLDAFGDHLAPVFALIRSLRLSIDNLSTTRDLLLPKLILGQLDVEELDIDLGMTADSTEKATA
jgi:type I restriction enzyme S subunit